MRKETAADGAAAMVVVLRGWPTQTEVQGWGQRAMAQELCELEAADIDTTAAPSTLLPNAGTAEPSPLLSPHIPPTLPLSSSFWLQSLLPNSLLQPLSDHPALGSSFRALLQLCPQYSHTYLHSNKSHHLGSTCYVPGPLLGTLPVYNLEFANL